MTFWRPRRPAMPSLPPPAPDLAAQRDQARLVFMQHEYNSIRAELVAAVTTQQTVMSYGLAAIAVIYTGLLASWQNLALRTGILSLAPLLLVFVWFVWWGEVQRLGRARWFLWDLEKKINAQLRAPDAVAGESDLPPADVLHWESWVRGRNRWKMNLHSRPAYHLATGLLCGTGLGTTVLSVVLTATTSPMSGGLRLLAYGGAAGFFVLCGYALLSFRRNPLFRNNGRVIS
ncbi:hypothetical protein SAMN05192558_101803 [Actinokineospora alba]|uniref:Uncharacterized protein n=1 Tax=Actinokineospora alba TaxID=504798 RepID=A0A1H0GHU0_9PSEU|nr:hypothetical protein [Actinokineospora alba]TDP69901.1 hypothetical protein C8E96_5497 [Actinokineospora alba]SDI06322.1 hypothetical protein SAMN05421871_10368 [Actinokineospora alba]SDO06403.1 hypothetical protein SAMN05192558_101803 [Actinokineospora alba]